ncbi:MAG TPA: hypothetical protein VF915_04290, partial [Reyranella sp.]
GYVLRLGAAAALGTENALPRRSAGLFGCSVIDPPMRPSSWQTSVIASGIASHLAGDLNDLRSGGETSGWSATGR